MSDSARRESAQLRRDAEESTLRQLLPLFNLDELRVLTFDALRLLKGRETHGPLDLSAKRDWNREEFEELFDARMYRTFAIIQAQDEAREQLHADVAAELAASTSVLDPSRSGEVIAGLRELRENAPWDTSDVDNHVVDEADITAEIAKR